MKKIEVSAPGKLMIFGEHAVVYGHPCIVTAVDQRIYLTAERNNSEEFVLNAPDVEVFDYKKPLSQIGKGEIPKGALFIEAALMQMIKTRKINVTGLKVETNSEFKSTFGFGSSSASTVCLVKAVSELYELNFSNQEIFDLSFKTVLEIQGTGSGFDVASAVYGGTLYFVKGGEKIEELKLKNLPLIVGYSGVKADTVELINMVARRFENRKSRLNEIYNEIEAIVEKAKKFLISENLEEAGKLMNKNQKLLIELGVSIKKLDDMIDGAKNGGAYGAKLSGAGGGDCMICIGPSNKVLQIKNYIQKAKGEVLEVKCNANGVKIEK